ncbi:CheR family methyltransferase [Granulicella sibirica]|uniref:protein-glutamate O-methyltransferase n=1 Tax=Granulicella sibirica TaxID=2479048 RepID=A0A4Q0T416_9BACT|nr:protein-glutamate O-methyltransferase CheR [Granulicella sibirica]RXH56286.1 Chemotaxis protein methyltransferase CheR [Granulicella sibirica]
MNPALDYQETLTMRTSDFEQIRRMVYDFCGVDLTGKQVLVGTRLGKKIRDLGFKTFDSYCEKVRQDPSGELFTTMIDWLTTNHTSFFREEQHFELLQNTIVPALPAGSPIKIWSAACSSGEEPYTIAFSLASVLGDAVFSRASILATDISTRVLERARTGLYPLSRLDGLSTELRRKCLLKGTGKYADQCLVKPEIRSLVDFRRFNLLEDCSSFGPFQVIFCRNVMIYFDQQTQETLVNKLASRLLPGGYLLIGHSESLNGINHRLQYVTPATYRKGTSDDAAASGPGSRRRVR